MQSDIRCGALQTSWTSRIVDFIEEADLIEFSPSRVICHTEIMREHLFATGTGGLFSLCGLIDFEPSMIAVPEYDFCSVGLFISSGEKGLFHHFLDCYGYTGDSAGIMRMLLLHRYSNMKWFMSTIPDNTNYESIEDPCRYWF